MSQSIAISNVQIQKDMFLNLFVTQMRNQNPLDPMDNTEFMNQLAQLTSMERLTTMSESLARMENQIGSLLGAFQVDYASGLLGRLVTFRDPQTGQTLTDRVSAVNIEDGQVRLAIAGRSVRLEQVVRVEPSSVS